MLGSNARGHGRVAWRRWLGGSLVLSAILIWVPQPVYAAVGGFVLAQWRTLLTGLVILGLAGIAGSAVAARRRPEQEAGSGDETKPLLREIPGWAIWAGMAGLVVVGLLATWWLVTTYGSGDPKTIEQNRIKLEAIKLAGSVVVGTGGVAALLLAARRQRVSELDLLQRDRVAEANRHDADERRATELYTAAAEQLASDKAPVRMAGMYALSRLGETNENLRQTIINLLCAYLRMPDIGDGYNASPSNPEQESPEDADAPNHDKDSSQNIMLDLAPAPLAALTSLAPDLPAQQRQELEVRLTAQRLLAQHLRPNRRDGEEPTNLAYWPDMDIDLAGATLHELDFVGFEVRRADFREAQFFKPAFFNGAQFHEVARFNRAQFADQVFFDGAQFHDTAGFNGIQFENNAFFHQANFRDEVWFDETEFHGIARFMGAQFQGEAWFDEVQFHHVAGFNEARFHYRALFNQAQFYRTASFDKAQFHATTKFSGAAFHTLPTFEDAWALPTLGEPDESTWPTGWAVYLADLNIDLGRLMYDETSDI